MSKYLIIPRIQVFGANAQSAYWLVTGPSPLAMMGLVRKLAMDMGIKDSHKINVAIVHHDLDMRGEHYYGEFNPCQLRGGALTTQNKGLSDDYVKNGISMGLQPVALCDLNFSLIIEGMDEIDDDELLDHLMASKFAGGSITCCHAFKRVEWDDIIRSIGTGFFLKERTDLLAAADAGQKIEAFIKCIFDNALMNPSEEELKERAKPWLVPMNLGYLPITKESIKITARDTLLHAYAEPMVSFVEYVSIRLLKENELKRLFWSYRKNGNAFVVTQP